MAKENSSIQLIRNSINGTEVTEFYSDFCPRMRVPKSTAKLVLKLLENQGYIRINWKSKHGARYYLMNGRRSDE